MLLLNLFTDNAFMLRALVACIGISVVCPILGVFLMLRRMSMMGDAIGHAILPGVAIGYLIAGMSLLSMTVGGLIAGCIVTILAGVVSSKTEIKEDASFAAFYLISVALGVVIISTTGTNLDLMHILFGSILAINHEALILLASVVTFSLIVLAVIIRPMVIDIFDPSFLKLRNVNTLAYRLVFLFIVVFNLVVDFQIIGTVLVIGLMMLPANIGKLLAKSLNGIILVAIVSSIIASFVGIILSFYYDLATGPAIILCAGVLYLLSLIYSILKKLIKKPHFKE